jgi:hypothetical protein
MCRQIIIQLGFENIQETNSALYSLRIGLSNEVSLDIPLRLKKKLGVVEHFRERICKNHMRQNVGKEKYFSRDIKMTSPCKRYRKVYTWQVFSIRHIINIAKFATLGVAARPAILENRGGKSHFCDYFIIRARYVYLS